MSSKRFAVIGDPVGHSKSPHMHESAYRALSLPHTYEALPTPADVIGARIEALRRGDFHGYNVTVPHKTRMIPFLDELAPSALIAGAVNTIVRDDSGRLVGHNTDAPALAMELSTLAPELAKDASKLRALVIGSGGAARSAICALALHLRVGEIVIRARSVVCDSQEPGDFLGQMRQLLDGAGASTRLCVEPFAANATSDASLSLVVQATSAGMHGGPPGEGVAAVVTWSVLASRSAVLDVVYVPAETPFLSAARAHGIRHANGIGMLARQGALAFELWIGQPAPIACMLKALE